jgi:hypothetical protein
MRAARLGEACRVPRSLRAERNEKQQRYHQRHEHGIEVGWSHRDLAHPQRVDGERVERAEQHRAGGGGKQQIVDEQQRLPRDDLECAAGGDPGSARHEKRQRAADHEREQDEDEDAAARVGCECVHRGEHARAHQERPQQRERECGDREQQRPALQRAALFSHCE